MITLILGLIIMITAYIGLLTKNITLGEYLIIISLALILQELIFN